MIEPRNLYTHRDPIAQRRICVLRIADGEDGPALSLWTWPDRSSETPPPMAISESVARGLLAALEEGMRIIEAEMPAVCTGCGEHCQPDEDGRCWCCTTMAELMARRRRAALRSV